MTDFDFNQSDADQLTQGMSVGGGVRLPFEAPNFYFLNGNADANLIKRLEKAGQPIPPELFGGWAVDSEVFEEAVQEYGDLSGLDLHLLEQTNRENKEYAIYFSRYLFLAPISYRESWIKDENGASLRRSKYFDGARRHVQMLALLAKKEGEAYLPWGPAVLTTKGFQALKLLGAAKEWETQTAKARKEYAPKIPPWAFWMALGTFGKAIETEMVGKKGAQSPITPLKVAAVRDFTLDLLKKLYVGKEAMSQMVAYLNDAHDWLDAWKQQEVSQPGGAHEPEFDQDYVPEEQIPF